MRSHTKHWRESCAKGILIGYEFGQTDITYLIEKESGHMNEQSAKIRTFTYPNAIVRVIFPDISDEENERRMKLIKKAAAELLKEKVRVERENKQ